MKRNQKAKNLGMMREIVGPGHESDYDRRNVAMLLSRYVDAPLRVMSRKCWRSHDRSLQTPPVAS